MKHLINVLARCLKDNSLKCLKSCVNRDNKETFYIHFKETFNKCLGKMFKRHFSETSKNLYKLGSKNRLINVSNETFNKCLSKLFKRCFIETFKILRKQG